MFKEILRSLHRKYSRYRIREYMPILDKIRNNTDRGDLWNLQNLLNEKKPHTVLEFGSGCSTYIFAQNKYVETIYTVEYNSDYGKHVLSSIPEALRPKITMLDRDSHPKGQFDFIYVDSEIPNHLDDLKGLLHGKTFLLNDGAEKRARLIGKALGRELKKTWLYGNYYLQWADKK